MAGDRAIDIDRLRRLAARCPPDDAFALAVHALPTVVPEREFVVVALVLVELSRRPAPSTLR